MHPVLFTISGTPIHAYAVLTVLGYGFAAAIGLWLGRRDGRPWADLLEGAIVIVLSAVLGAKIFHTLFEAEGHNLGGGRVATGLIDLLSADPWHWARLFEPGYVFYGGVVGGLVMGWLFMMRRGIPDYTAAGDYIAPGFVLGGIIIGRLGCVFAGCCYGKPSDIAWAISFPASHASGGVPLHPVQLYDVTFGIIMLAWCAYFYPRRKWRGQLFGQVFVAYAGWRFVSEMFRGDANADLQASARHQVCRHRSRIAFASFNRGDSCCQLRRSPEVG